MKKTKTKAAGYVLAVPCIKDSVSQSTTCRDIRTEAAVSSYLTLPAENRRTSQFKRCLHLILESPDRTFVRDLILDPVWKTEWLCSSPERDAVMMGRQEVMVHAVTNFRHPVRMEVYLLLKELVLDGGCSFRELEHLRWMISALARCDRHIREDLASWSDILTGDSMR